MTLNIGQGLWQTIPSKMLLRCISLLILKNVSLLAEGFVMQIHHIGPVHDPRWLHVTFKVYKDPGWTLPFKILLRYMSLFILKVISVYTILISQQLPNHRVCRASLFSLNDQVWTYTAWLGVNGGKFAHNVLDGWFQVFVCKECWLGLRTPQHL